MLELALDVVFYGLLAITVLTSYVAWLFWGGSHSFKSAALSPAPRLLHVLFYSSLGSLHLALHWLHLL